MAQCLFCNEEMKYAIVVSDLHRVTCPRCGEYLIVGTAIGILKGTTLADRQKANISGWLNENQGYTIYPYSLDALQSIKTPPFAERADKLLLKLEKITKYAGQDITISKSCISWGWFLNNEELGETLRFLSDCKRLVQRHADVFRIAPAGWEHLEKLKQVNADSQQGFVAMWFDNTMQEAYDIAISEGIVDAGYKPHKVDLREHNDKIDDEIITQIRRSRFVLADFTGQRGGVYFEAGFGKGLGLEVFWTCRKDDIDNLHFDIRQYNCIDWESDKLTEFRKRITNRIESVIGKGTYKRETA
jgi:hypothetical protein